MDTAYHLDPSQFRCRSCTTVNTFYKLDSNTASCRMCGLKDDAVFKQIKRNIAEREYGGEV